MELKGSKTYQNLMATFAGESMARNKYTFFAEVAKKAGFEQIAAIFQETADNEKEHAKRTARFLGDIIGDTAANLQAAVNGEHEEWTKLYKEFAQTAKAEGFEDIAHFWHEVGEVEEGHDERYSTLLQRVTTGTVFKRDTPIKWRCRNCGYIHEGTEPPQTCPACLHPRGWYEPLGENY
jgi:rubrerythrin